jgi:hypothetical protein
MNANEEVSPQIARFLRAYELATEARYDLAIRLFIKSLLDGVALYESALNIGICLSHLPREVGVRAFLAAGLNLRPKSQEASALITSLSIKRGPVVPDQVDAVNSYQHSGNLMGRNVYCTMFDMNYAPRAFAMLESLYHFDPKAFVFALCLDSGAKQLCNLFYPNVHCLTLVDLESYAPKFKNVQTQRTRVEVYFTATSILISFLLRVTAKSSKGITYLDADLIFYDPIEPIHQDGWPFSAQIIEHRFSDDCLDKLKYGRFNVGWVSIANNEIGRDISNDYMFDCLAWCYDRLEKSKFADQKYLDYWVDLYDGVYVLERKGANVASWNIRRYKFERLGERFYVDEEPLLFYHFHGVRRTKEGHYYSREKLPESADVKLLYHEYFRALKEWEYRCETQADLKFMQIRA